MSLTDLTSLASLVSSVAVLVSLLFIGLQIRQSNRNQRSLMQQGRSARNVELLSRLSDPRLSDVMLRVAHGETLTDTDYFVLYGYMASVFWSYEDRFFQFHSGMLDAKSWAHRGRDRSAPIVARCSAVISWRTKHLTRRSSQPRVLRLHGFYCYKVTFNSH